MPSTPADPNKGLNDKIDAVTSVLTAQGAAASAAQADMVRAFSNVAVELGAQRSALGASTEELGTIAVTVQAMHTMMNDAAMYASKVHEIEQCYSKWWDMFRERGGSRAAMRKMLEELRAIINR